MLTACLMACLIAAPLSDVFSELTHDEALATAVAEERLLLIDFTADWCAPCKRMDETTWADRIVEEWVAEHALALQIDIDEQRDVAERYEVTSLPTIVVLREGEEFDRVVGYRDAGDLIGWLDGVREGRRQRDRLRELIDGQDDHGDSVPVDVMARFQMARQLLSAGLDDEASLHYQWLWESSLKHSMIFFGVRSSFLVQDLELLAARHEPTRVVFHTLFEREQEAVEDGARDMFTWKEWLALASIVQREDDVLQWILDQRQDGGTLSEVPSHAQEHVMQLLVEHDRLADAAGLYPDLVQQVKVVAAEHASARKSTIRNRVEEQIEAEAIEEELRGIDQFFLAQLLLYHRVACAADRPAVTGRIEQIILRAVDEDTTRLALARQALETASVRHRHVQYAADALAAADGEAGATWIAQFIEELRVAEQRMDRPDGDRPVRKVPAEEPAR